MTEPENKVNTKPVVELNVRISEQVLRLFPEDVKWLESRMTQCMQEFIEEIKPKMKAMGIDVLDSHHETEQVYKGKTINKKEVRSEMETNKN